MVFLDPVTKAREKGACPLPGPCAVQTTLRFPKKVEWKVGGSWLDFPPVVVVDPSNVVPSLLSAGLRVVFFLGWLDWIRLGWLLVETVAWDVRVYCPVFVLTCPLIGRILCHVTPPQICGSAVNLRSGRPSCGWLFILWYLKCKLTDILRLILRFRIKYLVEMEMKHYSTRRTW